MLENFERKRRQAIPTISLKIEFEKLLKVNETPVETPLKVFNSGNNKSDANAGKKNSADFRTGENFKYKTMPCRYFHANLDQKCGLGDRCIFIHDYRYEGRDLPSELYMHIREEAVRKERREQRDIISSGKKKNHRSRIGKEEPRSGKKSPSQTDSKGYSNDAGVQNRSQAGLDSTIGSIKKKLTFSSPQSTKKRSDMGSPSNPNRYQERS